MSVLKNYAIMYTLYNNEGTVVYRAKRISDDLPVIIKTVRITDAEDNKFLHISHEHQILSALNFHSVPKVLDVLSSASQYSLIFEDIAATSLYELLSTRKFTLSEALTLAVDLAKTLEYLHNRHVIHADINPKNIIYNAATKAMMLIDYGFSIVDTNPMYNSDLNVGTSGNLLYMSPEQTGRTKQKIDFRSDLYSLGMTLYHLFSGQPPFDAKNRYELIHKQVALIPESLCEICTEIPVVISRIVDKLIQKKPDLRYRSDASVIHDLSQCLRLLDESGHIADFVISTHDADVIHIGERLFGREKELLVLREAVWRMQSNGPVCVLVKGASGVGKTRFMEEIFRYTQATNLTVLNGKFNPHSIPLPYMFFKQIFVQLRTLLLAKERTAQKIKLSASSTKILSFLFVELRVILKSSHTYGIQPIENIHQKLPYALQEFFSLIATAKSPFIFLLDDLQWADSQSLEVIKKGFINANNPYLHFLGSYRDEEGVEQRINEVFSGRNIIEIPILPLNQATVCELLEDNLAADKIKMAPLAKILYQRTGGNPFYLKTMLEVLVDEHNLYYENGAWKYSLERIKKHAASINVSEIINTKYEKLPVQEKLCLSYLSLLGNRYNRVFTSKMIESFGLPGMLMNKLREKGFIEFSKKDYLFVHNKIRENVYDALDPHTKSKLNLKIGKYLEDLYNRGIYKDINTVTYHLNHGYVSGKFPKKLFKLNMSALSELVKNGLYDYALKRLRWMDAHAVCESLWINNHKYAYEYGHLRGKILYFNAAHDEAIAQAQILISNAGTIAERLTSFTLIKNICATHGKNFNELVEYGNVIFSSLGIHVPIDDAAFRLENDRLFKKINPLFVDSKTILNLPMGSNARYKEIASLLVDYWEAAYYLADVPRMQWSALSIVYLSSVYGNTTESCFGYVLLGGHLVSEHKYKEAYEFGSAALKLNAKFDDVNMLPKVYNFMANFINPYFKSLRNNIVLYKKSLHQSKINGDIVFGTWANFLMHLCEYFSGHSLELFNENVKSNSDFILASGDEKMIAMFKVLVQTVNALQKHGGGDPKLEEEAVLMWEREKFYPALAWYGIIKAQTSLLKGQYAQGLEYLNRYVHTTDGEVIMFPRMRLHFIRVLLLLGMKEHLSAHEKELLHLDIEVCESLGATSYANFKFGKLLLKAEQMKDTESIWNVARVYDDALRVAKEKKSPFFTALIGLCASRYWNTMLYRDLARFYYNEALIALNAWGAYEMAAYLARTASKSSENIPVEQGVGFLVNSASMPAEPANFQSLLNSLQAISKTLNTTELVNVLMQTILENATASRAILILKEGDEFYTKATIDFALGKIEMCGLMLSECPLIPHTVVQYAINTGENVFLDEPLKAKGFNSDSYIQMFKPASCTAISSSVEGHVTAVLYLENQSVATPLSSESIRTLELLLTQASIVLKSSTLYETLKKSEENLRDAQEIAHLGGWKFNALTEELEWSEEVYRIYDLEPFGVAIDMDWFNAHLHPDDVEFVHSSVENALSGKRSYDLTHRIVTANGAEKIVHQLGKVYWDGNVQKMSGTIQDITRSEHAKSQISRLSQVVDQNPFSTIITNHEGIIQYVNTQCMAMTGYFENEMIGKKMSLFCSGIHSKPFYADLWNRISVQKQMWRGTIINKMKSGKNVDCLSTIFPIFNSNDGVSHFVTVQEDVTEQNIKDKLFMMQTRQAQMGEMISMIAHQWRQPLSVIGSLINKQRVDIALDHFTMEGMIKSIGDVDAQIQYLSQTITDFRDFFKPDKEKTRTTNSHIIDKGLKLIGHSLKKEGIETVITCYKDDAYDVYEHEMVQVILNLLKNAQDAFEERKIIKRKITISSDRTEDMTIITVEDNAQGIDPSVLETLFLPYVSTKGQQNGTGLGLYMCKTIVEEHCHGSMWVENTANGAKFTITLPMKDNDGTL